MRVLFAGSPAIAVLSLETISEMELDGKGIVLAGILTNRDSRRGRHGKEEPTDVSAAALALDLIREKAGLPPIPQLKPAKLDGEAREAAAALAPDILVSFAYGRIFGPRFLALFPKGGINIHPSLLPKYRGASPVQAAIINNEKETGISIQRLAPEIDSGDILAEDRFCLSGRETAITLSETMGRKAALLLRELLLNFDEKSSGARPQEGTPVYCREIKKEDGLIDWGKSATEIDAQIRAFYGWPLSFTSFSGEMLYILEAEPLSSGPLSAGPLSENQQTALKDPGSPPGTVLGADEDHGILIKTGNGVLAVKRLQLRAKKALDWKAFCNGVRGFTGARLGQV